MGNRINAIEGGAFFSTGNTLWANGWSPLPLAGKRPVVERWSDYNAELPDERTLAEWLVEHPGLNTGIAVAHGIVAIDVDIEDVGKAKAALAIADDALGRTPLLRIGRAPRLLLVYRWEGEHLGKRVSHPIEIYSGAGQFAAFGIHPDTGKPWRWARGHSPLDLDTRSDTIPLIGIDQLVHFFNGLTSNGVIDSAPDLSPPGEHAGVESLGSWMDGVFGRALHYAGMIEKSAGNKASCVCPNEHAHTSMSPFDTIVYAPIDDRSVWGYVKCEHSHCKHVQHEFVRDWLMNNKGGSLARAISELEMDVPPAVQVAAANQQGTEEGTCSPGGSTVYEPSSTTYESTDSSRSTEESIRTDEIATTTNEEAGTSPSPSANGSKVRSNAEGKPSKSHKNLIIMIRTLMRDGVISLQFHERRLRKEIKRPGGHPDTPDGWAGIERVDAFAVAAIIEQRWARFPLDTMVLALDEVAGQNMVDPVRTELESIMWDRSPRLSKWLIDYMGAEDTEINRVFGERWLTGLVARGLRPGVKFDSMLILEGAQGIGKSRALATLGGEWFSDEELDLGGFKDPAAALVQTGCWLHESSELASQKRSALEREKSFLARTVDKVRLPYARNYVSQARRCAFAGSTNDSAYLKDKTGNRRYWRVKVGVVDLPGLARDRTQLLAEAVAEWQTKGEAAIWIHEAHLVAAQGQAAEEAIEMNPFELLVEEILGRTDIMHVATMMAEIVETSPRWLSYDRGGISVIGILAARAGFDKMKTLKVSLPGGGRGNKSGVWAQDPARHAGMSHSEVFEKAKSATVDSVRIAAGRFLSHESHESQGGAGQFEA